MTPEKKITLNGKEVGFKYCLSTEQAFETIAGYPLAKADLETEADMARLSMACILAYKYAHELEEAPLTLNEILFELNAKDIIIMVATVQALRKEWYTVSEVETAEDKLEEEEEEENKPKN